MVSHAFLGAKVQLCNRLWRAGTQLWEWLSLGWDHPSNISARERFPDEDKVPGFRTFSQVPPPPPNLGRLTFRSLATVSCLKAHVLACLLPLALSLSPEEQVKECEFNIMRMQLKSHSDR